MLRYGWHKVNKLLPEDKEEKRKTSDDDDSDFSSMIHFFFSAQLIWPSADYYKKVELGDYKLFTTGHLILGFEGVS